MTPPLAGARVVVAVTAPSSASFYAGQLAALAAAGAEVWLASAPSEAVARQCHEEGARHLPVALRRAPAPVDDARALAQLVAALRRVRPDLVDAGTPKAGLLGMLAARAVGVPVRVQTLHGLRYEAARGAARRALWLAQRASCEAATHVVCVSRSLRDRAVQTGLLRAGEGLVIGDGSVNGVDTGWFAPAPAAGRALRARLGIADDAPVAAYLGRLAHDKGLDTLAAAWARLPADATLLLAGSIDETDPPRPATLARLRADPRVRLLPHQPDPRAVYAAADLLVLPSRREGFPTVVLEAAAMAIPAVATAVTGCVDAVVDGETGALVGVDDDAALAAAVQRYLREPARRAGHGAAARARAEAQYDRARVHALTVALFARLLDDRRRRGR